MEEVWKDIKGYEGMYSVSNLGNVYSAFIGRNLKQGTDKNGYKQISLQKNGKEKKVKVHRLVAMAFIDNPNNFPEVNHKDECKFNNEVSNLEWCNGKYNIRYSWARKIKGIQIGTGKVLKYDAMVDCIKDGFDERSVIRCIQGEYKQHHGYVWQYD